MTALTTKDPNSSACQPEAHQEPPRESKKTREKKQHKLRVCDKNNTSAASAFGTILRANILPGLPISQDFQVLRHSFSLSFFLSFFLPSRLSFSQDHRFVAFHFFSFFFFLFFLMTMTAATNKTAAAKNKSWKAHAGSPEEKTLLRILVLLLSLFCYCLLSSSSLPSSAHSKKSLNQHFRR
jgi:hypothetical protein